MAKIVKVDTEVISISTDTGEIKEARKADLGFEPLVGDEVDLFENNGALIVTKKEIPMSNMNNGVVNNEQNVIQPQPINNIVGPQPSNNIVQPQQVNNEQTMVQPQQVNMVNNGVGMAQPQVVNQQPVSQPVSEVNNGQGVAQPVNNEQSAQQPQAAPVAPDGNKKAVSKVTYCLLAFFLGGIGIHKFYAGQTTKGILYLVFSWTTIPAIIAFIEFIMALTKQADANGNIYV